MPVVKFIPLFSQDAAVAELSEIYGIEDAIDQHRDMRLDIDNMTYEVNRTNYFVGSFYLLPIHVFHWLEF